MGLEIDLQEMPRLKMVLAVDQKEILQKTKEVRQRITPREILQELGQVIVQEVRRLLGRINLNPVDVEVKEYLWMFQRILMKHLQPHPSLRPQMKSLLTDTDALFSNGGRIKRKYTDFLSTPKRDDLLRREETLSMESSLTESPLASNELQSRDLSSTSHDLPAASHDPPETSHDPPAASHDLPGTSDGSHGPLTASNDTLPKVLFTSIVDEEGQKVRWY